MSDQNLAIEIIARLNRMIEDPAIARGVWALMSHRLQIVDDDDCVTAMLEHPTIQVGAVQPVGVEIGALGLLNGIIGTIESGDRAGWGYVVAVIDDELGLVRFELGASKETT